MSGKHSRPGSHRDMRTHVPDYVQERGHPKQAKEGNAIVCDRCSVVYHAGRWAWGPPPLCDLTGGLCPACERIRDHDAAGKIELPAEFLEQREEVIGLIHNAEEAEKSEHPLERLMDVVDVPEGGLRVTTTGVHLARAITNKLERRFHKQARIRYMEAENLIHADWEH